MIAAKAAAPSSRPIYDLILACSRCSKLSQRYIEQVFFGLRYWSSEIELRSKRLESCVFLSTQQDAPRSIASWPTKRQPRLAGHRHLPARRQRQLLSKIPGSKLSVGLSYLKRVILSMAWSAATLRAAERIPCDETALITVGMNQLLRGKSVRF